MTVLSPKGKRMCVVTVLSRRCILCRREHLLYVQLPSLGMEIPKSLPKVLVPATVSILVLLLGFHVGLLRILLQIRHVVSSVATLQNCSRCLVLLLTFPEEVSSKASSQLRLEHVSARSLRRESSLVRSYISGGHDDWLSSRSRNFVSRTESTLLHHQGSTIVRVD